MDKLTQKQEDALAALSVLSSKEQKDWGAWEILEQINLLRSGSTKLGVAAERGVSRTLSSLAERKLIDKVPYKYKGYPYYRFYKYSMQTS